MFGCGALPIPEKNKNHYFFVKGKEVCSLGPLDWEIKGKMKKSKTGWVDLMKWKFVWGATQRGLQVKDLNSEMKGSLKNLTLKSTKNFKLKIFYSIRTVRRLKEDLYALCSIRHRGKNSSKKSSKWKKRKNEKAKPELAKD